MIENWNIAKPGFGGLAKDADNDGETSMLAAQKILARLRRRDLYKFVDEFIVPREELDADRWQAPSFTKALLHFHISQAGVAHRRALLHNCLSGIERQCTAASNSDSSLFCSSVLWAVI